MPLCLFFNILEHTGQWNKNVLSSAPVNKRLSSAKSADTTTHQPASASTLRPDTLATSWGRLCLWHAKYLPAGKRCPIHDRECRGHPRGCRWNALDNGTAKKGRNRWQFGKGCVICLPLVPPLLSRWLARLLMQQQAQTRAGEVDLRPAWGKRAEWWRRSACRSSGTAYHRCHAQICPSSASRWPLALHHQGEARRSAQLLPLSQRALWPPSLPRSSP